MVIFPNCKINLGLNIIRKREDGFHDLETVFYPVPVRDALESQKSKVKSQKEELPTPNPQLPTITITGLPVDGDPGNNLCTKAWQLLQKDFPQLPLVDIYLHKAIPMGAGLGGGSADGAFTLLLLNKQFQLGLSTEQLISYALQLGSDCPFFILNEPCLGTGRGEKLQPVALNLSAYKIIIVNPRIHINTGWAFSHIIPAVPQKRVLEVIAQPLDTWKDSLINDFEAPVLKHHPEIRDIKSKLYDSGAIYAAMSGSGSSFFGIFECNKSVNVTFPTHYFFIESQNT
jgi:4-diphosphocytidyl-2-C-methyl-D-erythritol kinase